MVEICRIGICKYFDSTNMQKYWWDSFIKNMTNGRWNSPHSAKFQLELSCQNIYASVKIPRIMLSKSTEQRTRSVSSGLSKQLGHMPRIRSKQSIHQMGRFAHLSVTLLTQYFSSPLSPVRSDPSKESVTNNQSRKGNLFDFFACRRS